MKEKWEIKKLGEVGDVITGSTPKTSDYRNYNSNDYCFVKPSDFNNSIKEIYNSEYFISEFAYDNSRKLPINSVLVTCIGNIGNIAINKVECTTNQQINSIIPKNGIESKFLAYSIFAKKGYLQFIANAPVVPILNKTNFSNVEIPIPPLPVQQSIVAELDTLHRLKELQEQQLAELDNLAQSTFYHLFGDPIENEKGWEVRKCEKLFDMKLGKMLSAKNYKGTHLKPYLRNVNVKWGELDLSDVKKMDFFDNEFEQYRLKKGDILVCEGGEVGRTAIYNDEIENCCYQNALHRLRIIDEEKITRQYFQYFMLIGVPQGLIKRLTISVTIQHFALVKFKNMKIPVPPINLQTAFAERIEKIEAQKELVKRSIGETQTLIDYTMDKYFG